MVRFFSDFVLENFNVNVFSPVLLKLFVRYLSVKFEKQMASMVTRYQRISGREWSYLRVESSAPFDSNRVKYLVAKRRNNVLASSLFVYMI